MLHLIFQSPIELSTLSRMTLGDSAVFFENALFRLLKHSSLDQELSAISKSNRLCVLAEDLIVRGIEQGELISGLEVIDYAELVNLSVANKSIQTWM